MSGCSISCVPTVGYMRFSIHTVQTMPTISEVWLADSSQVTLVVQQCESCVCSVSLQLVSSDIITIIEGGLFAVSACTFGDTVASLDCRHYIIVYEIIVYLLDLRQQIVHVVEYRPKNKWLNHKQQKPFAPLRAYCEFSLLRCRMHVSLCMHCTWMFSVLTILNCRSSKGIP